MSALFLLAFALVSYLGFSSVRERAGYGRWRAVAEGLAKSSGVFFLTLLTASIGVFVLNNSMGTDIAAEKLSAIEADLDAVQRWRSSILGSWDWRLVLGIVGVGAAGVLFAAEETVGRVVWVLRHVKIAGAVLAILAGLTISTLPAEEVLRDLELRYAEATDQMESDARAIEVAVTLQVRASAIDAVQTAAMFCLAPERPECRRYDGLHDAPPHAWLNDNPGLAAIWEGTYAAGGADRPTNSAFVPHFASVRAVLVGMTPSELSSLRQTVTNNFPVLGWRNWMDEGARKSLLGLAVDAGYDAALDAARSAGASGDLVHALLLPLVTAPVKALLERLSEDAVLRVLKGDALGDISRLIDAGAGATLKDGDSSAALESAANSSADILRTAAVQSGQALIDVRDAAARAAANNSTGGSTLLGGGTFTGIQIDPGRGTGTDTTITPYGGRPGTQGETVTGRGPVVR